MIPVNEPVIGERELEYVTECVRTAWVSSAGRFIEAFEGRWADYCGRRHGVAVSNGTAALQAAVAAIDLEPGDEVIMPTFTIISCAMAVVHAGGVPVLVDADPDTWTMDVTQIESRITPRTRAIMPVHIYGHAVDMDPVLAIAERHGLAVIEDAAEAHGAEYLSGREGADATWRRCGGFGDMSCFSFYANKLITTGEGGMVLTDDDALAERLRSLRNLCFQSKQRFLHEQLGFNFRMTNLQAALGLAQTERFDDILARKKLVGRDYTERLAGMPGLTLQTERPWAQSNFWMYGVLPSTHDTGMTGLAFARRLEARGVQTRPFFLGMHRQPALLERGWFKGEAYPVADHLAEQGVYLPSGLALTDEQLDTVCMTVCEELV